MVRVPPPVAFFLCAACAGPAQPSGAAQLEHGLFYGVGTHTETVDASGGRADWRSGRLDAEVHPRLAAAWEAGEAPSSPLIGRDHARWMRRLQVRRLEDAGAPRFHLRASALAPHPLRLSLVLLAPAGEQVLARGRSEAWSVGTHFADLDATQELSPGDVLVLRAEGAHQIHESRLRLEF